MKASFDDIFVDRSFPEDNAPTRKPRRNADEVH
jgi:hypothetical protein